MNNFDLKFPIQHYKAASPQSGKGCPFGTYTLRIVYKENAIYEYLDKFTGEIKKITSVPRYSKRFKQPEPHANKSIFQLLKIVEENKFKLQKAELYFNLNRGFRVNQFYYQNKSTLPDCEPVENILLHRFTNLPEFEAQKISLDKFIYELPALQLLDNEAIQNNEERREALRNYCDALNNSPLKIPRSQVRTIWHFFHKNFIKQ